MPGEGLQRRNRKTTTGYKENLRELQEKSGQAIQQEVAGQTSQGAYRPYIQEMATAFSVALGADLEKVEIVNPQLFGEMVSVVNNIKAQAIDSGVTPAAAGDVAFSALMKQIGVDYVVGAIRPGFMMESAERKRKGLEEFAPLRPIRRQAEAARRFAPPQQQQPFVVPEEQQSSLGELIKRTPGFLVKTALEPTIPESFVGDAGGFNKVWRETIRDMSSPAMIGLTLAFPGATQAAAGVLGRLAARRGADALSGRALRVAVKLIDDGTYLRALKFEARGEFGANILINALQDQGVELNMAQQIGYGLIGGVAGVAAPPVAARGIKAAAKSTGLDDWSGINLSDLDRPSPDWSPADMEAHRQRLTAGYDRPSAARAAGDPASRPLLDPSSPMEARVDQIIQQYGQRDTSDRFGWGPVGMRLRQARARERLRQAGPLGEVDRQAVRTKLEAHDRWGIPVDWHAALRAVREDPDDVRRAAERALPGDPRRMADIDTSTRYAETAAREPFDVIDPGFEQRYIALADKTASAEKTPDRRMSDDEVALADRDWKAYSRSREYTEAEINDQQAFMDMFEEGKRLGYTEEQLAGIAYEGTIRGRGADTAAHEPFQDPGVGADDPTRLIRGDHRLPDFRRLRAGTLDDSHPLSLEFERRVDEIADRTIQDQD
jgi:hypothetical protein